MSTLKVNAIEPYSGGTVTITGATVDNATSASYAETANTLTAGNKTVNGQLNVNGTMFVSSSINQSLTTILPDSVKTRDNTSVVQSSLETSFGGKIGLVNLGTSDDFGLTLQSENWGFPPNWTGPSIYSNNPAGEYPAIIGFQNKTNWTDGRVTFLTPIVIQSGSTIVGLGDYVDDAAAALGGVAVNGVYRTGSALKIRVS